MNTRFGVAVPALVAVAAVTLACLGACGSSFDPGSSTGAGGALPSGGGGAGGLGGGGNAPVLETVRVTDPGGPVAGVDVITNDAAGLFVAHATTNASGEAQVDLPAGGTVSVLRTTSTIDQGTVSTSRQISTADGLSDGGLFWVYAAPSGTLPAPMSVTVTLVNPVPNAATYRYMLSCGVTGGLTTSATYSSYYGCFGTTDSYDVFLIAYAADGTAVGHAELLDLPFMEGGAANHALLPANPAFAAVSLTASNLPSGALGAEIVVTAHRAGQPPWAGLMFRHNTPDPGSNVSTTIEVPAIAFDSHMLGFSASSTNRSVAFQDTVPALPAQHAWDLSSFAYFEALSPLDLTDVARPRLSWTLSQTGSTDGYATTHLSWYPSAAEGTFWTLSLRDVARGDARFPELPADLAAYRLEAGDQAGPLTVEHMDSLDYDDDFDAAVAQDPSGPDPARYANYRYAAITQ